MLIGVIPPRGGHRIVLLLLIALASAVGTGISGDDHPMCCGPGGGVDSQCGVAPGGAVLTGSGSGVGAAAGATTGGGGSAGGAAATTGSGSTSAGDVSSAASDA